MNRIDLKYKLDQLNVFEGFYSLNGELLPDRIVLLRNHDAWEVFYFDERGNQDTKQIFLSEDEACNYIYRHFEIQKGIENKYN
jgi:hypothetical protein